eukprot:186966-Chlamydomonas_euryale.AAC.6
MCPPPSVPPAAAPLSQAAPALPRPGCASAAAFLVRREAPRHGLCRRLLARATGSGFLPARVMAHGEAHAQKHMRRGSCLGSCVGGLIAIDRGSTASLRTPRPCLRPGRRASVPPR